LCLSFFANQYADVSEEKLWFKAGGNLKEKEHLELQQLFWSDKACDAERKEHNTDIHFVLMSSIDQ